MTDNFENSKFLAKIKAKLIHLVSELRRPIQFLFRKMTSWKNLSLLCGSASDFISHDDLEAEHLLHKLHDSASVDQSPLGACMIIWYQWTHYVMYVLDVCVTEVTTQFQV